MDYEDDDDDSSEDSVDFDEVDLRKTLIKDYYDSDNSDADVDAVKSDDEGEETSRLRTSVKNSPETSVRISEGSDMER